MEETQENDHPDGSISLGDLSALLEVIEDGVLSQLRDIKTTSSYQPQLPLGKKSGENSRSCQAGQRSTLRE